MQSYGKPSKRMRFDDIHGSYSGAGGNDDLWGDDLTAEEFDMLETQATQSFVLKEKDKSISKPINSITTQHSLSNGTLPLPLTDDEAKQQQYALEGKVKLLTYSLDKAAHDLKEERLNRESIISQRIQAYQKKEEEMKKEVAKTSSVLQFKEQEMKNIQDKVRFLEIQLKDKKQDHSFRGKGDPCQKSPNKFLKRCSFNSKNNVQMADVSIQTKEEGSKSYRKYKLNLNIHEGESSCVDIISSILCNRNSNSIESSLMSSITPLQPPAELFLNLPSEPSPAISLARLNSENSTEDLWHSYETLLRKHLEFLQNFTSFTTAKVSKRYPNDKLPSPVSKRSFEIRSKQYTILTCLQDLAALLSLRKLDALICDTLINSNENEMASCSKHEPELDSHSCPLLFAEDEKMDTSSMSTHPLLKLLVTLAQPKTYPDEYENRNDEIEWTLASIVAWCSNSDKLVHCIYDLPLCELISGRYGTMCIFLTLKLLTECAASSQFDAVLIHRIDNCLLCGLSSLCVQIIGGAPAKHIDLFQTIENLYSIILTIHADSKVKIESSPCVSKMLQGFIVVLWKFYQLNKDKNIELLLILRKGLTLLLQFSKQIPDFKDRRFLVQEQYISLVCGFLTLSKEISEFKEFYDDIRDLWDFQEDTSEFDLEEAEELSQSDTTN